MVAPCAGAWVEIAVMPIQRFLADGSLPVRERGLKSCSTPKWTLFPTSLPVRERGLKYPLLAFNHSDMLSLPVRERGLK